MIVSLRRLSGPVLLLAVLVGCGTAASDRQETRLIQPITCCAMETASNKQQSIARTAARLVGAHSIESNGRRISYDCAGVTRAIYLSQGIDLYNSGEAEDGANGVRLIHAYVRKYGRLHQGPRVRPGDLVFFDNTWDLNGDGRVNDPLTHVGVVETVESDGTVVFVSRVSTAIDRYRMNLQRRTIHRAPDGRVFNDYMRRKTWRDSGDARYLTGELFAGFGTVGD
ncbi:MAG: CHAP domain-containing protein [Nitrospiraceae bacterium]